MNIEIANRLVQLRKSNNLSQEALAEKLGISRQAVSKWERAEASPDTDNLILLARLYGVSLDELLKTEDEIPEPRDKFYEETETWGDGIGLGGRTYYEEGESADSGAEGSAYESSTDDEEYVHVGFRGIHVKDKDGEVHVGWDGIHVDDRKKNDSVHIDKKGVYVNGEKYDKHIFSHHKHFPVALIIIVIYVLIGSVWNAWHPGWLIFLLIPIWDSLLEAIERRDAARFAYPVLMVLLFLCLGIFAFLWHPGWVVFLTVPLYYSLIDYFKDRSRRKSENFEEGVSAESRRKESSADMEVSAEDEKKAGDLNEES
ncbi:MAG: helix-turn-helix domain-containing protein [Lachnospiraceae bacterium]|nr:helix-turn-helix domain-containing protein [Lachnospiraceae bacterium]